MNLRAVTWNLFLGGIDGASEKRLRVEARILRGLNADIVCLPECNRWDEDNERRLWWMANSLGLQPVAMVRSRLGTPPSRTTPCCCTGRPRCGSWRGQSWQGTCSITV
ncbi:hypothetical protein [Streptomyces rhizosphaericus]|uniref:hypothetical protein n=1 Tax=Streptomyces rhizosphaericus TaxID=114699 RepID=UPI0036310368